MRSQAFAVNIVCNILFISIRTHFLHISRKSTEQFVHSSWGVKNALCGKYERSSVSYLLARVCLGTYYLCQIISYKSSQHVNSQDLEAITLHFVLQTVKDIRMCWTTAGVSKQILIFCDITLLQPRTWKGKPILKGYL